MPSVIKYSDLPKIRGMIVPVDIFDEVVAELKTFRAARDGGKK